MFPSVGEEAVGVWLLMEKWVSLQSLLLEPGLPPTPNGMFAKNGPFIAAPLRNQRSHQQAHAKNSESHGRGEITLVMRYGSFPPETGDSLHSQKVATKTLRPPVERIE